MGVRELDVTRVKEAPVERVKEAFQLGIRPVKAKKIEQNRLLSEGETSPVEIPRFQAEIIAKMLKEKREVWHITPRRRMTLVLAVFDHEPKEGEITRKTVEEFLGESFQDGVSVELPEGPITDFNDLKFEVTDDRGEQTFDMAGLFDYINQRWWPRNGKGEEARETKELILEKEKEDYITVPPGTRIFNAPVSDEGMPPKVRETITKQAHLRVLSREEDPNKRNIIHCSIRGKGGETRGWVVMVLRGKKVEFL